jgi:hypothetical protein
MKMEMSVTEYRELKKLEKQRLMKFTKAELVEKLQVVYKQLQNTSSNSDYAKCKIEAEIKRLEDNPEGDYITRISALEWALRIFAGR